MKKLIVGLLVIIGVSFGATAVQMDFLMSGVMDNSGKPLSNGKVHFYINNGGTTTKSVYTSAAMTSALAQPLALNASGVPSAIPYGSGTYRIVWKTSAGTTIKTVTDVQYGVVTASTAGVIDVGVTYGYNNAAVASAISYAGANQTTLYFSPGEYTIATSKVFPSNVQVQFAKGAYFTIADGIAVSMNAAILAPQNEHIFRLSGVGTGYVQISTANNPVILGNWKGYTGIVDVQTTLNTTAIILSSAAINRTLTVTGTSNISGAITVNATGSIVFSGGITITSDLSVSGNVRMLSSPDVLATGAASTSTPVRLATSDTVVSLIFAGGGGGAPRITATIYVGKSVTPDAGMATTTSDDDYPETLTTLVPAGYYFQGRSDANMTTYTVRIIPLGKRE